MGAPDMSLEIQLSELRRSLDVATTKIDGQLAVLLQKSDYAEQRARESAERIAAELAARDAKLNHLETKLEAQETRFESRVSVQDTKIDNLKGRVYFMAGMASAVGGAVGVITTIVTKH
jgi:uncharacterized protein (DUF3084 family)